MPVGAESSTKLHWDFFFSHKKCISYKNTFEGEQGKQGVGGFLLPNALVYVAPSAQCPSCTLSGCSKLEASPH